MTRAAIVSLGRRFLAAVTHSGPTWQPAYCPQRGDAVEAWLKTRRDQHREQTDDWVFLDGLLYDYQIHADTGTPLDQHACENGTVDDCYGCYEAANGEQR